MAVCSHTFVQICLPVFSLSLEEGSQHEEEELFFLTDLVRADCSSRTSAAQVTVTRRRRYPAGKLLGNTACGIHLPFHTGSYPGPLNDLLQPGINMAKKKESEGVSR